MSKPSKKRGVVLKGLRKSVLKGRTRHKTELRDHTYKREFCTEPSCDHFGKLAQQGICFSKLPDATTKHLTRIEALAENMVKETKQVLRGMSTRAKLDYLYSHMLCNWMNVEFTLDELIRLRTENSRLQHAAGKKSRK